MPLSNPSNQTTDISFPIARSNVFGGQGAEIDDTTTIELVGINLNRSALTIINVGGNTALIDLVADIQAPECMVSLSPGAYYEFPSAIYTKQIYAKALEGSTLLVFRDFSGF
ncbi:hypothetical protein NIES4075_34430 [Tolypothrix sp. NIES-4075]|uniref:hypothetical protein n=1 Tax=Tolypothrix sp. NIES-4075 TaxID=2005459 RepID=UPI000B5C3EDA|nr:hypothetical protein [Tolypothrix sp. NIES-4075]GAX42442.1 hypothetical protein NIES4075_34430 [Tolypothrix sp. NIES-4075]